MTFVSLGDYPLMILTQEEAYTQFAAYEIATFTLRTVTHRPHHDIESFYWVLLWMVLRHSDHGQGEAFYTRAFNPDPLGPHLKLPWLVIMQGKRGFPLIINGDEPLTELMQRLKELVLEQVLHAQIPSGNHTPVLTHDAVVKMLDAALAEDRKTSQFLIDPVRALAIQSVFGEISFS